MGCCGGVGGQRVRVRWEQGRGIGWVRQCVGEGGGRRGGVRAGRGVGRGVGCGVCQFVVRGLRSAE